MRAFAFLCFAGSLFSQNAILNYQPITGEGRLKWVVFQTIGPPTLAADAGVAAVLTHTRTPVEYDTHWDGYAERVGMPLTILGVSNVMEAGLGAIWGEDPRYFRAQGQPFIGRLGHVMKLTFLATNREGESRPAYARYVAFTGSNFLANEWVPESEANSKEAGYRIGLCFVGQMASNLFREFWPDVKKNVFRLGN